MGTYPYLPNDLRLSKTVGNNTTYFMWSGDDILAELNGSYAVTAQYVYGTERIYNCINNNYYLYNNHGDTSEVTNANGIVVKSYSLNGFDAYGDEKNPDSSDTNPFRYCGEYYDAETGNIYLRARYYDPSTGSFITEDPARDGVNWYSYCAGNPVSYIDPSGMILKILGSEQFTDDMVGYLTELTNYTFKTVAMEESEGVFVMIDGVNDDELNYVYSNQLVKCIINSGKICTINESYSKENQTDYANKGEYGDLEELYAENRYNGIGMSADVYINPTSFTPHMEGRNLNDAGLWESQLDEEPNPMITVAHELIHAQRIMNGTAINNQPGVYKKYDYEYVVNNHKKDASADYEELVTVGLIDFGNQPINENSIRAEHGLNIRSVY